METDQSLGQKQRDYKLFKSYYVVWKRRRYSWVNNKYGSLNRTMQYGNFLLDAPEYQISAVFKSYYVVWKHKKIKKNIYHPYIRFKSYYVVWKLDPPDTEKKEEYMFKSYYVVWKLFFQHFFVFLFFSLNRTMQYGNKYEKKIKK